MLLIPAQLICCMTWCMFIRTLDVIVERKEKHTKCVVQMKQSWDSSSTVYLGQYFLSSVGPNESVPAEMFRG